MTYTILKYTASPRDSNPLSLVVYHDFYGQASNVLQYSVTLLTTFIGWGRALSDCHRQALFLVATTVMIYATGHLVPVSQLVDIPN